MSRIPRIGREPTVAERTLRGLYEEPERLELLARTLFANVTYGSVPAGWPIWPSLSEGERAEWKEAVFRRTRDAIARYALETKANQPG